MNFMFCPTRKLNLLWPAVGIMSSAICFAGNLQAQNGVIVRHHRHKKVVKLHLHGAPRTGLVNRFHTKGRAWRSTQLSGAVAWGIPFGELYHSLPYVDSYPSTITAYDRQPKHNDAPSVSKQSKSARILNEAVYRSTKSSNGKLKFPIIHTLAQAQDFQLSAESAFHSGRYDDSTDLVEQAIKLDSHNGLLKLFSSQTHFATGKYRIAAKRLNEATLLLAPEEWNFFGKHFAVFYGQNDYVGHTQSLADYVQRRPDDYQAKVLLGYHYGIVGHPDSATRFFHQALRSNPDDDLAQRLIPTIGNPALSLTDFSPIEAPSPTTTAVMYNHHSHGANPPIGERRKAPKRIYLTSQFPPNAQVIQNTEPAMTPSERIEAPRDPGFPSLDGPNVPQSVLEELPEPLEQQREPSED